MRWIVLALRWRVAKQQRLITNGLPCPARSQLMQSDNDTHLGAPTDVERGYLCAPSPYGAALAPRTSIHGVLVDILGRPLTARTIWDRKVGVCAELDAVRHRLIADDVVEVTQEGHASVGRVEMMRHLLEVRGSGSSTSRSCTVSAVRYDKRIDMVVELAAWREGMQADRLGLDEQYYTPEGD